MKYRHAFLCCGAAVVAISAASPAFAQDRDFDIPAQSAVRAIPQLARQAQMQIIAPAKDLAGIRTPAIKGRMPVRVALQRLIAGTPLRVASDDGQTITLRAAGGGERRQGSGALSGKVVDQATGEYLRDASVTVVAGDKSVTASSGEGGEYNLSDLPAGCAKVTVSFIGYLTQEQDINILPNNNIKLEIDLRQSGRRGEAAEASDIVINGERQGESKSIMAQRKSMDITDVLSTEAYGDIAGGNPAEFLKYMPGVDVDGTNGTAVYAYLRGLPAEFTRTELNGMDVVSANANAPTGYASAAAAARIFSYESISLSAIDSVTIYKTVSADNNADAPAGIIDLRTKRAYDRKKPLFVVSIDGFTHENMLDGYTHTGPQPNGWGSQRFLPEGSIFYANSFLNNRLGVMVSLGYNNSYIEREQITMGRSYAPTAKSSDPLAYTSIDMETEGRQTTRRTASAMLDFKATNNLTVSLLGILFRGDVYQSDPDITFTTGARTNGVSGDALSNFTTLNPATTKTITSANTTQYKVNNGNIIAPSFEWNSGRLHLDGYFAYSDSRSYYDTPHKGEIYSFIPTVTSTGNFQAAKGSSNPYNTDWNVTQTSGPDWSDPSSYTLSAKPEVRTSSGANAYIYEKSAGLNASYDSRIGKVPISFKVGAKITDTVYEFGDTSGENLYTYTGPLTNAQFMDAVTNPNLQTIWNKSGASFTSLSDSNYIPTIDPAKLYQMYVQNPGDWTHTLTAANYAAANYSNNTKFEENIKAVYAMATADLTPKLKLRVGLRAEWTNNTTFGWAPLSATQVKAATVGGVKCAVTASTGIATTIPCVDYQFQTNGYQATKGHYFNFFPSASLKYTIGQSTDAEVGYSRTVLRPGLDAIAGSATVDDIDKIITVPNPALTPAMSDNISVRLSRYFRTVGLATLGFYYNRIDGLADQEDGLSADQVGAGAAQYANDPQYAGFTYTAFRQLGVVSIKGVEASLQHSFSYLPSPFNGLSVRGSFMHNSPSQPITRVGTNIGSAAVIYEKGPVRLFVNILWNDDKYRSTTPSWFQARTDMSISGRIKLIKHWEAFFLINNVLNEPYNVIVPGSLATTATNFPNHSAIYVQNGRTGTFGIRARF